MRAFLFFCFVLGSPILADGPWIDEGGAPLPFAHDEEVLVFLESAEVVESREVSGGTTKAQKLTLERGGARAHAVFRSVELRRSNVKLDGRTHIRFRDSYVFEVAAYKLSRLLGLDTIPPTTLRTVRGTSGSIQLWIEQASTEADRIRSRIPTPGLRWQRQIQVMKIFDALIDNFDRNHGNMLIGDPWRLWMIDHTRAFTLFRRPPGLEEIVYCERALWNRLQGLEQPAIQAALGSILDRPQLTALVARLEAVVEHLEKLIDVRGEAVVIFEGLRPEAQKLHPTAHEAAP